MKKLRDFLIVVVFGGIVVGAVTYFVTEVQRESLATNVTVGKTHVNKRVIPTSNAIDESCELAHEIFDRIFRHVSQRM